MPADLPPFNNLRKALTDLEQCLTCAYCSRIYTNPFTLTTCGHTFCEQCVLIFVSGVKAQSLCPLCNIPIWLNQSQTNRQLKGLLQHYHQIRSLLGIQEPINVIPIYLKPKPDPKQRKGRKKSGKLFSNQSRDTLESPQSVTDHSKVQTDDSTLREDTRSLTSQRETNNVNPVCDVIPSERSSIIDSKDGQEVTINEANSNSHLVESISPLTNANIKLCDDVMPTDSVIQEVIDNSDKLTSTPANGDSVRRAQFQPYSKYEMLPRSINFFQLIDNEDSSLSSENIGKQKHCIEQNNTSPIVSHPSVQSPVHQQTVTPPIIPLTQRQTPINFHNSLIQDSNINTQSPDIQRTDMPPIIPLTQRQTPTNFHNSLIQDSNINTQSSDIQRTDMPPIIPLTQRQTPTNFHNSLIQDSNINTQSSDIQRTDMPPIIPLTQRQTPTNFHNSLIQDSNINTQSSDIQRTDMPPIIPLTQRQTPTNFHNSLIQDSNINTQSSDIQRTDMPPIIPLTQRQTPTNFHNSLIQDSNINTQSSDIQRTDMPPIIPLTQRQTPTNFHNSLIQDSNINTQSPDIQRTDRPPIIPLTQRQTPTNFHNSLIQDSNINTQSSDIQRTDMPPIIPLTQRQTPTNFHNSLIQDSNINTQSSDIQLDTLTPGEIQETVDRNSQSSDDSVIIESVQLASNSAIINEVTPNTVIKNEIISPYTKLEPETHTRSPCTKTYDSPQGSNTNTHSTYMCASQPLPYEHILQVQKNLCHIPQIQLFNPILRFPPYNPTAQFLQIQTRTNSAVYYYPQQVPVRPKAKFVSNVNCPFRPNLPENYAAIPNSNSGIRSTNRFNFQDNSASHQIIEPKIPTHFDINATPEKIDSEFAQRQLTQHNLEVEQKPLDQIHNSVESILSSPAPDSPQNVDEQADINESENELSILCNGKSPINDSIGDNISPELRENDEDSETIQNDIEPSRNSISDSFLRKYSLQLSPCPYSQNIQMNEVLSVAKDLSNKISRIDSDEDSNFSLGYQSPKFMRNITMAKSPIINSLNRLACSPMARSSPENENAKISFTSPRVSTMESYNSEMTICSSLNIIDYADMSIDESLYKEKHFSPSLTSPIPSNHIKRRSNGFKSKKIKLSVGGIYNKRNKDSKTKSLRILSPTKSNEVNQIPKPQGKTRSMRKRYPQVS